MEAVQKDIHLTQETLINTNFNPLRGRQKRQNSIFYDHEIYNSLFHTRHNKFSGYKCFPMKHVMSNRTNSYIFWPSIQ